VADVRAGERVVVALVALGVLVLPGCSGAADDAGEEAAASRRRSGSAASSPFSVDAVPEGFELLVAGTGDRQQVWGEDCCGTDSPFTVLVRDGGEDASAAIVSVAGYADTQGGFAQASRGYIDPDTESLEVDGKPARWWPGREDDGEVAEPELAVDEGDDLAVLVTGVGLSQDELIELYERVEPQGRAVAPEVSDPPSGWRVVGSVDAEGVLASRLRATTPVRVPAGRGAHAAGWQRDGQELVVATVPGRHLAIAALAADARRSPRREVVEVEVDGRATVTIVEQGDTYRSETLAYEAAWGDVVVLTAIDPARREAPGLPTVDDLLQLAGGIDQTTEDGWDGFVTSANGGPGLGPDLGVVELGRGEVDGIAWLLQSAPPASAGHRIGDLVLSGSDYPSDCLKLDTGERACVNLQTGSATGTIWYRSDEVTTVPDFVIVTTIIEGVSGRLVRPDGSSEPDVAFELHRLPGGRTWGGVAFATAGLLACPDPVTGAMPGGHSRIEVLDASGVVRGCVS
jgi:hypothetical protein